MSYWGIYTWRVVPGGLEGTLTRFIRNSVDAWYMRNIIEPDITKGRAILECER